MFVRASSPESDAGLIHYPKTVKFIDKEGESFEGMHGDDFCIACRKALKIYMRWNLLL
jgi:hypothetical protein